MKIEFKLIFVDRTTLRPAMEFKSVTPQIVIDLDEFHRTNNIVNPARGMAQMLSPEQDKRSLIESTALLFSEMYGADVYYKTDEDIDWHIQKNVWKRRF